MLLAESVILRDSVSQKIHKLFFLMSSILIIPLVLVMRLVYPLVIVRFGKLRSERIAHFVGDIDLYLCRKALHEKRPRIFDVFYCSGFVSNHQLKRMLERLLCIFPLAKILHKANSLLPGAEKHSVTLTWDADGDGLLIHTKPHLFFTPEEESCGYEELMKMGISKVHPFACLHTRDSAYMNETFKERNWSYHDYRDAKIDNYLLAAEELVKRGYIVLRMGAVVNAPLVTSNQKIIDYATKYRTDFMDVFLSAKCNIFLGMSSGIYAIPRAFRRPIICTNVIPLRSGSLQYLFPGSIFIPKKLWLRKERRFMTFKEIWDADAGALGCTEDFDKLGVEVIENTPEEILDVTVEGEDRYRRGWQETDEDEELQKAYWEHSKAHKLDRKMLVRVGAKFLRENKTLLGLKSGYLIWV